MWDCCRRYQERGILLQPLLTLCLYGWQKEQSLWPWGWTHNCRNGPSSQAFLLHITERDRTGDWGGQRYNLEEINQRSRVHGTERLILHPDTGRVYAEHCQSLGVSDSGLTSRSCRQPCPCVRVSVCPCARVSVSVSVPGRSGDAVSASRQVHPAAFPGAPPAHAAQQAEPAHPGDRAHSNSCRRMGFAGCAFTGTFVHWDTFL